MAELKQLIERKYSTDYNINIISEEAGKKIISYRTIQEDLMFCLDFLNELKNPKNSNIVKKSCTLALLTLYGRAFTQDTSARKPKLESAIFGSNNEHLKSHGELMKLRHSFAAHRGESLAEQTILFMLTPKIGSQEPTLTWLRKRLTNFSPKDIARYQSVIACVIFYLEKKILDDTERFTTAFNKDPSKLIL